MKNLKPHSRELLEFARSIGATHWHELKMRFVKEGDGHFCKMFGEYGWEIDKDHVCPSECPENWKHCLIDFSPLDAKPDSSHEESKQEPDWTTAPEGAAHWGPENDEYHAGWYKESLGKWRSWSNRSYKWLGPIPWFVGGERHESLAQRPAVNQQLTVDSVIKESLTTEWNGTGLPPVGCDCEYFIVPGTYKTCTFVGINSRKSLVIENEYGEFLTYHNHQIKFRPIKSDRERWIDAALGMRNPGAYTDEQWAADLYDAGLAKLPEQPNDHSN